MRGIDPRRRSSFLRKEKKRKGDVANAAVFNTLHQSHFEAFAHVVILSYHETCLKVSHGLQCCHHVMFKIFRLKRWNRVRGTSTASSWIGLFYFLLRVRVVLRCGAAVEL